MIKGKFKFSALILAAILLGLWIAPSSAYAHFGTLSSVGGGIMGTGNWIYTGPTWIEWNVTQNNDNSWHYSYDFGHPAGETSHFILEVSDSFTADDIFSESGDFDQIEVGFHTVQSGNPNMPETIYGIRFEEANGLNSHFEFNSFRVPVWGDFYAKNGNAGGHGLNTAWNAGFTLDDYDPLASAADGSLLNHILVPDSDYYSDVPEPSTLALLGIGIGGYLVIRRRRK